MQNGRMRKKRGGERAGGAEGVKKKKEFERNRIGRSNYLVVKWPKCRVSLILNNREGIARILYNELN